MYINIYKWIINLIIFVTATISFVPNVAGDLSDLQVPPQPCSIKDKTDSDNTGLDNNDNNNNNNNNNDNNKNNDKVNNSNNNNYFKIMITIIILITIITI